ncbi:MAG: restriction endonuclease subunit S [Candidatus Thiodiazotropha sp. DIVDIV]
MGRYRAYPEYRDSEVKWLGRVPSHWVVSKFGYVKTVLTDYTANGSFADLKKNVVYRDEPSYARLVRLTDLRVNLDNPNGVWIDEDSYNYLSKSALFGGEFLLANVGAHAGLFYQMPENKGNASLAPNMFMAKFDSYKIVREFMAYVGQSQSANEQLRLNATASSAQPKLNKDDFKSVRFGYPALDEQEIIANFLDHETAKIDTLIEKQQQLIKLLKEKRQAVISHAVTKGLTYLPGANLNSSSAAGPKGEGRDSPSNPDAPMRDSGVEWLGEVPGHWEVSKFGYISSVIRGGSPRPAGDPTLFNGDYSPWVTVAEITKDEEIYLKGTETFLTKRGSDQCRVFSSGTLLISNSGATLGVPKILSIDANANDGVVGFENLTLNHEFAYYYLSTLTDDLRERIKQGSGQPNLNTDIVKNIPVPIPPVDEVEGIVVSIRDARGRFKTLEEKAKNAIELLQERRTALISAAVTGKIDVRDWTAPEPQTNKEDTA